jgi:hypothetical protein
MRLSGRMGVGSRLTPGPGISGDPSRLVAEWSAKFAFTFDARGHIIPQQR